MARMSNLYGNAAIANGRVYFTTRDEIYCIGTKDAKPAKIRIGTLHRSKRANLPNYWSIRPTW